jgi:hypothetical protein
MKVDRDLEYDSSDHGYSFFHAIMQLYVTLFGAPGNPHEINVHASFFRSQIATPTSSIFIMNFHKKPPLPFEILTTMHA